MAKPHLSPPEFFAASLRSLMTQPEVLRLIHEITTCTLEWEGYPPDVVPPQVGVLELFPRLDLYFQNNLIQVKGTIYPNLVSREWESLSHVIRLELAGTSLDLELRTAHNTFLLSPFHIRFLSILFGRLVLQLFSLTPQGTARLLPFTPYSLEEQVVAGYLQSLERVPCATIKLDIQDNPYIGSMLHNGADLRRCELTGRVQEEAIILAWRLFKRLLYYSVEGERLSTGFAMLGGARPLEYYCQRLPGLLLYQKAHYASLSDGVQSIKQFLLNANGRNTFLALYRNQIVGLLHLPQGTLRQLTTVTAWRSVLPLVTISHRGLIRFWVSLKGRHNHRIPRVLTLLEYRHGQLYIPLFHDVFFQELDGQLKEVCPGYPHGAGLHLKNLLTMLQRSGHGGIIILGLSHSQLDAPNFPLESQVRLVQPLPLQERWLPNLLGLTKSDGALIFNQRLEACQFRARLKPTPVALLPEKDDLGSGMRHQVTREFSVSPNILGLCISQDGHISIYRHGRLVSRLY